MTPALKSLSRIWRALEWYVVGALALAALALGYAGLVRYCDLQAMACTPLDLVYLELNLFTLNFGVMPGPIPWQLEVARFLAPGVAAYAALQALAVLFSRQLQLWSLRFFRGHVIIAGLGRKGFLLAKNFRAQDMPVVIVEPDLENDFVPVCQELGAVVLPGDAREPASLRRAGVERAAYLLAVCGDDGLNAEIAMQARQALASRGRSRGGALTCVAHIVDPALCQLLREREFDAEPLAGFRLELFNVLDSGARILLDLYPPFEGGRAAPPHLLIVGLSGLGESLSLHAARRWREHRQRSGRPDDRLRLTAIDPEAGRKLETLRLRYPFLSSVCDLRAVDLAPGGPEFQRADFLRDGPPVDQVYVCLEGDALSLSAGLHLLQQTRGRGGKVLVRLQEDEGLASLLRGVQAGQPGQAFRQLRAFGLLERVCRPDLLRDGTHETVARTMHQEYVQAQRALGETAQQNPVLVDWEVLPEAVRESNRRAADHIGFQLNALRCGLAPLADDQAEAFALTPDEVEQLAQSEHARWCEEKRRDGWRYAPGPKNAARKTNPDLVDWEQLPESEKDKNRLFARGLPAFLARAGFQIYRFTLPDA